MGKYYSPEKIEQAANLKTRFAPYDGKQPRIAYGHRLVAVLDNGLFKAAPDVTSAEEYSAFYNDYYRGQWLSMDLYEISEEHASEFEQ